MITKIELSTCCNAPTKIVGSCDDDMGHFGGTCNCDQKDGVTVHWECTKCRQPCDIVSPNVNSLDTSKPPSTEQPPSPSVFKEESPQPWEYHGITLCNCTRVCYGHEETKKALDVLLLTTKLETLERVEKEVIGSKPDLDRLKDKSYSDNDRLWWEAVWDTKRKQLAKLTTMKEEDASI